MKHLQFLLFLLPLTLFAQTSIEGTVFEKTIDNKNIPLAGATIYWKNTTVGTVTDFDGNFSIPYSTNFKTMIISYIGYKTNTIQTTSTEKRNYYLTPSSELNEVKLETRKKTASVSYLSAVYVNNVDSAELLKAACCNLAESFETNPSIDVNFADAVSGTKQIKMLGLTSPYLLITTENIPSIRGAAQAYGMSFIPGTWVESIQVTKGAGSVSNGFESIAGQINAELKKPLNDDDFFFNAYTSLDGRSELNTHINTKVSDKWDTGLYIHGNLRDKKFDNNNDNFLDAPLANQINIMNRWQYIDPEKGTIAFINFRYLNDDKQSGELNFDPKKDKLTNNFWGAEINTDRLEVSANLGFVNPDIPYQKLSVQVALSHHKQDSYFGLNSYDITHQSMYSNVVYSSIISDSRHQIKTGASFTYDDYNEQVNTENIGRIERSLGGFFEYAFDNLEAITLTAGIRLDHHNLLGTFVTPRFHMRYAPWEKSAFRMSFGRGKRSANIFTENQKMFATSRKINILNNNGTIYGLNPEIAWNYGLSFLQGFNLFGRKADVTIDFFRTDFKNQVVVDWETPTEINFYNLEGDSFANSFQVELNYSISKNIELRMAYKNYNVKTDYKSGTKEKPLLPKNRFFTNISYDTNVKENGAHWKFDATYNYLSKQRFPSNLNSPIEYQAGEYSPTLSTLNAQATKIFSPKFEMYAGGENITNVKQKNPVISADAPFGAYFDSTYVYGPIFGASYYVGLRYKLNKN
ncbi:MAG: TonB-dependent receptor [Flavobacteriaceae bacterium]|nr:MAG: TonB-dependent receptor [Flavobacteriaceae bacterium]